MDIVDLPDPGLAPATRPLDLGVFAELLFESAELLLEAQRSEDPHAQELATSVAVRSLRAAGEVLAAGAADPWRSQRPRARAERSVAPVLAGPWTGPSFAITP